jgi:hypothetical protein
VLALDEVQQRHKNVPGGVENEDENLVEGMLDRFRFDGCLFGTRRRYVIDDA